MSYGFEINDNLGNLALNSSISTMRIVHQQFCTWDYNSSFSVPNFDSTKGEYYMRPHFVVAELPSAPYTIASTGTNYDYDFEGIKINNGQYTYAGWVLTFAAMNKPTLSWNNSTKVMSVTQAPQPPFSSVDNPPRGDGGDYTILFFEVA